MSRCLKKVKCQLNIFQFGFSTTCTFTIINNGKAEENPNWKMSISGDAIDIDVALSIK